MTEQKRPVQLTSKQQNMLAEIALHMSYIQYDWARGNYVEAEKKTKRILESWLTDGNVTSQDWGKIYDIMHRTGENA